MDNGHSTIRLLDQDWKILLPDYVEREELCVSLADIAQVGGMRLLRIYAAMLGLCTPLGKAAKADYARCKCDPLVYGGQVYSFLRKQGASLTAIAKAGAEVAALLQEDLYPREGAVDAQANFTALPGDQ